MGPQKQIFRGIFLPIFLTPWMYVQVNKIANEFEIFRKIHWRWFGWYKKRNLQILWRNRVSLREVGLISKLTHVRIFEYKCVFCDLIFHSANDICYTEFRLACFYYVCYRRKINIKKTNLASKFIYLTVFNVRFKIISLLWFPIQFVWIQFFRKIIKKHRVEKSVWSKETRHKKCFWNSSIVLVFNIFLLCLHRGGISVVNQLSLSLCRFITGCSSLPVWFLTMYFFNAFSPPALCTICTLELFLIDE